ncbi:MAG: hypothetical protein GX413_04065 [Acetobacter sp.]|jgi:hypothetical protein|nr:hypothetical protein [Acetobacter sp.]
MSWVHNYPLTVIGLFMFAASILCLELGYQANIWVIKRRRKDPTLKRALGNGGRDYLLTAMLGLMALLLGFTFSLSLNRFESRRGLVVQEANALRTAWDDTQLLAEPNRTEVSTQLRLYIQDRLQWSTLYAGRENISETHRKQKELWKVVAAAVKTEPVESIGQSLLDATSHSFDIATSRLAARSATIPDRVLNVLFLYILLASLMLGEVSATYDGLHRLTTWLMLFLLTLAILIILDLDRASDGVITVSQQALMDLNEIMR